MNIDFHVPSMMTIRPSVLDDTVLRMREGRMLIIKINPGTCTVDFVETKNFRNESLWELLDGYFAEGAFLPNGDVLLVDEEGDLKKLRSGFFFLGGRQVHFVGNGLIVGVSGSTYSEPKSTLTEIIKRVEFTSQKANS